ncbi:MAG: HD domain-containing protein [Lachnospiraceae bacterium]|nr:HD domain-containing protein [Lachnospiraceae bacterium]
MNERAQRIAAKLLDMYPPREGMVTCRGIAAMCSENLNLFSGTSKSADQWMMLTFDVLKARYFPDNFSFVGTENEKLAAEVMAAFMTEHLEYEFQTMPFDRCRHFQLLTREELVKDRHSDEYKVFMRCLQDQYFLVFFRLSVECTPFDTLGHIAGVHHVSMYMARQIAKTNLPIDLSTVSAAAILHDIGKFGCTRQEAGRVPYLHYYYTAVFASRFHLDYFGHIAANHSTWDLEFDNLSLENLLLIYADFRVKSTRVDGKEVVIFSSLKDAYDVILNKLDNVDDAKKMRYEKVYRKLKTFEDYLVSLGISTDLVSEPGPAESVADKAFLEGRALLRRIGFEATEANLRVMHALDAPNAVTALPDENDAPFNPRFLRISLSIIDNYSTYLTAAQKNAAVRFLCEMLAHRDGDIRRQAAGILGRIIAHFDAPFTKELPAQASPIVAVNEWIRVWKRVLARVLTPDYKTTYRHRRWLGFTLKTVLASLLDELPDNQRSTAVHHVVTHYKGRVRDNLHWFILMENASVIPWDLCTPDDRRVLETFALKSLESEDDEIVAATLRFLTIWRKYGWPMPERFTEQFRERLAALHETRPAIRFLKAHFVDVENGSASDEAILALIGQTDISAIVTDNQMSDTPWIFKLVHIDMLNRGFEAGLYHDAFKYAVHLVHLLQVEDRIVIRHKAGSSLVALMGAMGEPERYEIALEMIKGLENGADSSVAYMPNYLGGIFVYLSYENRKELLRRCAILLDSPMPRIVCSILRTVGVMLDVVLRFGHDIQKEEIQQLEGLLYKGMADYREEIRCEAFYETAHDIFYNTNLTDEQKLPLFCDMYKKIYHYLSDEEDRTENSRFHFLEYTKAALWKFMYRLFTDRFEETARMLPVNNRVVFYPGTFDPFTVSHKAIVELIRERGCEVYIGVDEFSWSKNAQPNRIRRRIISMSTAAMPGVYLFPESISVNIANPLDIKRLKSVFAGKNLAITMGSDVVEHASAYRQEGEDTVKTLNHLIFHRPVGGDMTVGEREEYYRSIISGRVECLSLPKQFEAVSSTMIRDNIDRDREISGLVDRSARNFINAHTLYVGEPVYKPVLKSEILTVLRENDVASGRRSVAVRRESDSCVLGIITYRRPLEEEKMYLLPEDRGERKHVHDNVLVITALRGMSEKDGVDHRQTVLTEFFAAAIEKGCRAVITLPQEADRDILRRQGFVDLGGEKPYMGVLLRKPLLLFANAAAYLKAPFSEDPEVRRTLRKCHEALQRTMADLYPGFLVFSPEADVMNGHLIRRILEENGHAEISGRNTPGPNMCVPFGRLMNGLRIPRCVTKDLNVEKFYDAALEHFEIREFPYFSDIRSQMRAIRSFRRPVILIDDLFDRGHRFANIKPYIDEENVPLKKMLVGVLTHRGRETALPFGLDVEGIYNLKDIRAWFVEADLYPFIGGDSIETADASGKEGPVLASINPILPYRMPRFLKQTMMERFYVFSDQCLENAEEILKVLEKVYQEQNDRCLTVKRLGKVITEPRCPEGWYHDEESRGLKPSDCVALEKKRLRRMKSIAGLSK